MTNNINPITGQINVGVPQYSVGQYGEVIITDPQNSDDLRLKHSAKAEIGSQVIPRMIGVFAETYTDQRLKPLMDQYATLLAQYQREASLGAELGRHSALTPTTFHNVWNEYKGLKDAIMQNSKIAKMAAVGKILQDLFVKPEVLNNLTGAGVISQQDAGLLAEMVTDTAMPLDFLTTLTACFVEMSVAMTKAMANETNVTLTPQDLAQQLMDAISKLGSKAEIEREQLNILENYGVLRRGEGKQFMINQNAAAFSEAERIKATAAKPKYLWGPDDYALSTQVDLYLQTGQLPADTFNVQSAPVIPQGVDPNRTPNAIIMNPMAGPANFMTYQNQSGTVTGNQAFAQAIAPAAPVNTNGVGINKGGDMSNMSQNLVRPNPQMRAAFNNTGQAINPYSNGVSAVPTAPAPTYGQPVYQQPQAQPAYQAPVYPTYSQPVAQPAVNALPTGGYPVQPAYNYPQQVNSGVPQMVLPNTDIDKQVSDNSIIYAQPAEYGASDPTTNSRVFQLINPQTGAIELCTELYYNHRKQYLTNPGYKAAYDQVLMSRGQGGVSATGFNQAPAYNVAPSYTAPATNYYNQLTPNVLPTYGAPSYGPAPAIQPSYTTPQGVGNTLGYASNDPLAGLNQPSGQMGFGVALPGMLY